MESLNLTRDESKALLSVLIDQKEQIEAQIDKLNFQYGRIISVINELNEMLTNTETKAPAELVDMDWHVGNDRDRLNRINRALQEEMEINKLSDDLYQIVNGKGKIFIVSISDQKGSCTCMDFQKRGQFRAMPCKHLYAVGLHNDAEVTAEKHADLDTVIPGIGNGVLINDGGEYVDEFGTFATFRAPEKHKASDHSKQLNFSDDHPRCVIEQEKRKHVHDGGKAENECWKVKGEGAPVLEVWESYNGDLYFITEKDEETGDVFMYARLYAMPQFAEWGSNNINYLIEQYGEHKLWKVPMKNWGNIWTYEKGLLEEVSKV